MSTKPRVDVKEHFPNWPSSTSERQHVVLAIGETGF